MGKTYLTRESRSTPEIEDNSNPFGDRRLKILPESSESFAEEATSIQPLDGWRLVVAEGGEESSKPKILQIRAGKVMEKNQRCWSGACFRRKDSTAAQAEAICAGKTAAETVAARSVALAWVSVA